MRAIPAAWIRGGTSKGLFFKKGHLPPCGVERDRLILAALGSLWAAAQWCDITAAFKLVKEMREEADLVPDEIMYNSLLDGCAQGSLVDDGLRVLREMEDAGVKPSNFTLSVLVKLMSRARRVDYAFELVQELSDKYHLSPNSHVYANLVQACCFSKQLQRGLKTLEDMMDRKVQPDKRTYSMLLRLAVQQGQFEKADGLLRGALGVSGALPFLNTSWAICQGVEEAALSETLSSMAGSPEGNKAAAGFLVDVRKEKPNVWIDPSVQRLGATAHVPRVAGWPKLIRNPHNPPVF
eukprot:s1531_g23.t1